MADAKEFEPIKQQANEPDEPNGPGEDEEEDFW